MSRQGGFNVMTSGERECSTLWGNGRVYGKENWTWRPRLTVCWLFPGELECVSWSGRASVPVFLAAGQRHPSSRFIVSGHSLASMMDSTDGG
jgi:hypothetical protein